MILFTTHSVKKQLTNVNELNGEECLDRQLSHAVEQCFHAKEECGNVNYLNKDTVGKTRILHSILVAVAVNKIVKNICCVRLFQQFTRRTMFARMQK